MSTLYQLLPSLSSDEYEALKADIAKNGIREPIEYDTEGNVLDGHHRLQIAEELGLTQFDTRYLPFESEKAKREHVYAVNLLRRHLSAKQKREIAVRMLKENPRRSDNSVAQTVGMSPHTIGKVRTGLENAGDVCKTQTRTDSKGRNQPARKPKPETNGSAEPILKLVIPDNFVSPARQMLTADPLPPPTREERAEANAFAKELTAVLDRALTKRPEVFMQLVSPKIGESLTDRLRRFSDWATKAIS